MIAVHHAVAVDTFFLVRRHARFAALDRSRVLGRLVPGSVASLGAIVTDGGADDRPGDGCGIVAAAAAELMTDDATDHRTDQGAHAAARYGPLDGVVLGLLPALPYRRIYCYVANDRL